MNKDDLEAMYAAIKRIEKNVAFYMGGKKNIENTAIDIKLIKKQIETELDKIK